jgi:hypothetical protein
VSDSSSRRVARVVKPKPRYSWVHWEPVAADSAETLMRAKILL